MVDDPVDVREHTDAGEGTEHARERVRVGAGRRRELRGRPWPFVDELFATHAVEARLAGVAVDPASLRSEVDGVLDAVLTAGRLTRPADSKAARVAGMAGRDGVHTEAMGYLLAEMQHLHRSLPGAVW